MCDRVLLKEHVDIEITITGSPDDGFTAAELFFIDEQERHYLGRVFEREDSWHYETVSTVSRLGISLERFVLEIDKAKEALRPYANRIGMTPPPGLMIQSSHSGY